MPSIREKEIKKISEEIMELLTKQTVKEKSLCEKFRSKGGKYIKHHNIHNRSITHMQTILITIFYNRNTCYGILSTWY